ncbi:hypothetical protein [Pseudomonas caspiana]|uniref:Uncharacterized protein n=1 Tax=Pseudomonas caspiana TaxID=1451454 RepID=A0A1Y3P1N3_9PSED|nr:hypothetical protein [Pseudomonas caspiana]OUM73717.1 hypothetical protein AUC60_11620 [Pseudomonas caspiana]
MFKQSALAFILMGTASNVSANTLTEEQSNLTKCAGYLWAVKELSPNAVNSSLDIIGVRMKAVSQKDDYPMMIFATLRDTANTNSQIIVSYVTSQYNAGKNPDIKAISIKGIALCKKSGITIGWQNDKMSVSLDDIGDVL